MKYIVYPILKILLLLIVILIYICGQILHILWHLKPDKCLLKELAGEKFYCKTHRENFQTNWFDHRQLFKRYVVPKSLLQLFLWEITHYNNFEISKITKREEELYKEFCKNNKP